MDSAKSGEVVLQCEANCWLRQPELKFLDDQGNDLPAEDSRRDQDASGCYSVRRKLTLQTATNRFLFSTCAYAEIHKTH